MKRLVNALGIALAVLAGGYFVYYSYHALAGQDLSALLQVRVLLAGLVLLLLYMALIPSTALAWTWLLKSLGQPTPFGVAAPIFATTQFGKYLPGNVAHHLGRVAMAKIYGVDTLRCVLSMGYEMLFLLLACAHVSALTLLWEPPLELAQWPLAHYRGPLVLVVSLGALLVMAFVPSLANIIARRRAGSKQQGLVSVIGRRPSWLVAFACYLIQVINFALVGVGLWVVAAALAEPGSPAPGVVFLIGAFAGSWVLGFLAPGAPAGLGVREAVLSVWLAGTMNGPEVVALIIALRLVTTVGDVLNFAWGTVLIARLRRGRHAANRLPC